MPAVPVPDAEMRPLLRFLRTLQPARREIVREKVQTVDGKTIEGELLNQGFEDLQLRTVDNRVHLLRRAGNRFREVTSSVDWPGYNGDAGGNRYTTLSQITKANGEPVKVDYMMRRNGDNWLICDIYLDGAISEVATRRAEFAAILKTEGIDGLIDALNRKADILTATTARSL